MDPLVITFAHTVNLLYQYWIHTETFEVHGWFGTYREFVPGVKPVYGTLTPVLTTNPLKQAVAGWGRLIQKIKAAPDLKNRALCLIKPPGWVPEKL